MSRDHTSPYESLEPRPELLCHSSGCLSHLLPSPSGPCGALSTKPCAWCRTASASLSRAQQLPGRVLDVQQQAVGSAPEAWHTAQRRHVSTLCPLLSASILWPVNARQGLSAPSWCFSAVMLPWPSLPHPVWEHCSAYVWFWFGGGTSKMLTRRPNCC